MILYYTTIVCVLAFYIYQKFCRSQKVPSGLKEIPIEKGLPIIGIVNKIERPLCNYLVKLGQKHGPIYRFKMGMRDIVVLNTFEYVKAALTDNGNAFSGRWKAQNYTLVTKNAGLGFIDGPVWAQQRSFVMRTLKDFGIGRSRSAEIIQDECVCMLEDLNNLNGKIFDLSGFIPMYTANVICKFLMNKRFLHGDPELQILEGYMIRLIKQNDSFANFALMFPFIESNEWLMKFICWVTSRESVLRDCHGIFEKQIEEHLKILDFNSEGEDLMDRFLIMQHQLQEENGNVGSFTNWQLVRNGLEMLAAGYDTTSSTLVWGFMFMAMYPDVQNKVYQEIIDQIGNQRYPTMMDKLNLKYTQAVMDEIFRLSSILPLSLFHRTLYDVSVKGYFIPKDTIVIPNLFGCHVDQNIWERPFEFYPDHFLTKNDNGEMKYKPREELIVFSVGKRQCIGESLARMEFFIFFTSILQRFQVKLAKEKTHFDVFNSNEGIIRTIDTGDFVFNRRR